MMSDNYNELSRSLALGDKAVGKPTRTLTFDDIPNPSQKPNNGMMPVSLEGTRRQSRFLEAPKPPENTRSQSPYRVNNLISAAQLFKNRPYLLAAAVPVRGAAIARRKPVGVAMTSIRAEPEPRASSAATGTPAVALSTPSDQEIQVSMTAQKVIQTSCLEPQHTVQTDEKSDNSLDYPELPATPAVPGSAEQNHPKESQVVVPGMEELRIMVRSFLVKITEKHDPVSRELREEYACYRGRVQVSQEIQNGLLMKASRKHTEAAESRILKREAGFVNGLATQTKRGFEVSRHHYEDSELAREVADILKAVDTFCDTISLQWSAMAAASTPSMNLTMMPNIDTAIAIPSSAPQTVSNWVRVADPGETQQYHRA